MIFIVTKLAIKIEIIKRISLIINAETRRKMPKFAEEIFDFPDGHIGSITYRNYRAYSGFEANDNALKPYILSLFKYIKRRRYSL